MVPVKHIVIVRQLINGGSTIEMMNGTSNDVLEDFDTITTEMV